MTRDAFFTAELVRRTGRRRATAKQYQELGLLAREAGIETPSVFWYTDAEDAIKRLQQRLAPPMLEGFPA